MNNANALETGLPGLEDKLKGADILMRNLAAQGVDCIFGYTGGASLEIFDAIGRLGPHYGIRLIDTAKEDGAGFAAQGYARATGKVGVVLTTSGPGATNALTPLTDASLDSIPIVLISGQVPGHLLGKNAFQEAPVTDMSRPVTRRRCRREGSFLVKDIGELPNILEEAFYVARSGRPGPVHIDITKDAQQKMDISRVVQPRANPQYQPELFELQIDNALRYLKSAERPILYVGGGIISSGASKELLELAEYMNIPVTTTLMGLGGFPGSHKNNLGMLGMHGTAYSNFAVNGSPLNDYLDGADVKIGIGARYDDRVTGNPKEFAKHATKIQVDIDSWENGKNVRVDDFIGLDAKEFLHRLLIKAKSENHNRGYDSWWQHIGLLKEKFPLGYDANGKDGYGAEIPNQYVIKRLYELTRDRNPIVTTGVGQHQMWAAQYFLVDQPRKFLTSGGLGTMGFGLPAAIGAQAAFPNEMVIDIDGDRSFWMTANELETITRFNLPVKVLVLDNNGHGMVRQWQDGVYGSRYVATEVRNINFAKYAELFEDANGNKAIGSERVRRVKDVECALSRMINHKGPYLLHVDTKYEKCLPFIKSGGTIRDIKM